MSKCLNFNKKPLLLKLFISVENFDSIPEFEESPKPGFLNIYLDPTVHLHSK